MLHPMCDIECGWKAKMHSLSPPSLAFLFDNIAPTWLVRDTDDKTLEFEAAKGIINVEAGLNITYMVWRPCRTADAHIQLSWSGWWWKENIQEIIAPAINISLIPKWHRSGAWVSSSLITMMGEGMGVSRPSVVLFVSRWAADLKRRPFKQKRGRSFGVG